MTVGCQTIHTTMVVASIATITETGVETVNRHHGITIPATIKVKTTQTVADIQFSMNPFILILLEKKQKVLYMRSRGNIEIKEYSSELLYTGPCLSLFS